MPLLGICEGLINIPPPIEPPFEIETFDPIEPPWQAIKQWIPTDNDEISFHWQDAHHSNESPWKPREVPLDEDRILALDVDDTWLNQTALISPAKTAAKINLGTAGTEAMLMRAQHAS